MIKNSHIINILCKYSEHVSNILLNSLPQRPSDKFQAEGFESLNRRELISHVVEEVIKMAVQEHHGAFSRKIALRLGYCRVEKILVKCFLGADVAVKLV